MASQVIKQVSIRKAAAKLGVSEQTIRRRLHNGLIKGHQENPPNGPWLVEMEGRHDLGNGLGDGHQDQDHGQTDEHQGNGQGSMAEIVAMLKARVQAQETELEARRREVQELHVLLRQTQAALPAPTPTASPNWWSRLFRRLI